MKQCPNGHEISGETKFCPICGTEVIDNGTVYCAKCGNKQEGTEKFCSKCGTPFGASPMSGNNKKTKKSSKKGIVIAAVVCLLVLAAGGAAWYYYCQNEKYSLEGLAKVVSNFDVDDDRIGDDREGWAFFNEGLALVCKGEKYGYIDKMGNEVIPCIYDWTVNGHRNFHEGLVLVGTDKDKKVFFINTEGKEVFSERYDIANDFHEGLALVRDEEGHVKYIDKKGNETIVFTDKYYPGADFSEGLAAVWEDGSHYGKHGYIDKKGDVVIPMQYERGADSDGINFHEGLAVVYKDGYEGYIDKKGNEVIPCKYEYASPFKEGRARVEKDGKYGYIDKKGNVVIPCIYEWANLFSEGYAFVSKDGENWSCIDKNGKEIFSCNYDCILSYFHEGLARVNKKSQDGSYDSKCGFIDTKGNEVIPCIYDFCDDFSEGLAVVGKRVEGRRRGFRGMEYGFVDKKGKSTFDISNADANDENNENNENNEAYSEEDIPKMKEFLEKFYSGNGFYHDEFEELSEESQESYLKKNLTTKAMGIIKERGYHRLKYETEIGIGGNLVDCPTIRHIKENTFMACFTFYFSPEFYDYQIELTVVKENGVYKIDDIGESKVTWN